MQQLKRSPGALARDATEAKVKGADTHIRRSPPRCQTHRLGRNRATRRPAFDRAKSLRTRSDYPPGSAFKPDEETLARRQGQVLELLKEHGPEGITRLEAPDHLMLSFSQRVSELRRMGYRIDSEPERVGDIRIARYVLVSTASGPIAITPNGEAGP